jgi:hypothetical protein
MCFDDFLEPESGVIASYQNFHLQSPLSGITRFDGQSIWQVSEYMLEVPVTAPLAGMTSPHIFIRSGPQEKKPGKQGDLRLLYA